MDIEKIRETLLYEGMEELRISKVPTFLNKNKDEGILIEGNSIKPFRMNGFERDFSGQPSENILKIIEKMDRNGKETGTIVSEDEFKKLPEKIIPVPEAVPKSEQELPVLIPEQMTALLLEKWKKMSTFDRMLLFQKTPKDRIKYKPKGNREIPYVEGHYMQTEANIAFLFEWSDRIEGFHFSDQGVACYGAVKVKIDGREVMHSAVGIDVQEYTKQDRKPIFSQEEMMKNAHTDMIKKALSKFGLNSDVYRGDV